MKILCIELMVKHSLEGVAFRVIGSKAYFTDLKYMKVNGAIIVMGYSF